MSLITIDNVVGDNLLHILWYLDLRNLIMARRVCRLWLTKVTIILAEATEFDVNECKGSDLRWIKNATKITGLLRYPRLASLPKRAAINLRLDWRDHAAPGNKKDKFVLNETSFQEILSILFQNYEYDISILCKVPDGYKANKDKGGDYSPNELYFHYDDKTKLVRSNGYYPDGIGRKLKLQKFILEDIEVGRLEEFIKYKDPIVNYPIDIHLSSYKISEDEVKMMGSLVGRRSRPVTIYSPRILRFKYNGGNVEDENMYWYDSMGNRYLEKQTRAMYVTPIIVKYVD